MSHPLRSVGCMSLVLDPQVAAALDTVTTALDGLAASGAGPVDARDAITLVAEIEGCARRLASVQIGLLSEIDRRGLHKADGHGTVRAMVAHVARLSGEASGRRAQAAKALRDLPAVAAGFAAGRIGACHIGRIALCHANVRVRAKLIALDPHLAVIAETYSYDDFHAYLTDWTRRTDASGTRAAAERCH